MRKTAVVFSPIFYQHNTGKRHPESAKRLRAIISELKNYNRYYDKNLQLIKPEKAQVKEVELVHAREYIDLVKAVCKSGGGLLDLGDIVVSPESYDVALYAVGGVLKAVNLVMESKFRNAFAIVRPPGHHATKFRGCGFCIFNNVATAAKYLLEKFRLKRILILDIDAHHGNGTQETFYETNRVLYISIHQDPQDFPGTGFIDEIGKDEGLGYSVNIPLPYGTDDQIYLRAMNEIVKPIVRQYEPQFILVSAGFDGHYTDPVGSLSLSTSCYKEVFETVVNLASENCEGKLVCALEGGYSLKFIGKIATGAIAQMSGNTFNIEDRAPALSLTARKKGEKILMKVKKVQESFWRI